MVGSTPSFPIPTPCFGTLAISSSFSAHYELLPSPRLGSSSLSVHLFPNRTQHSLCTKGWRNGGTTVTMAERILASLSTVGQSPSAVIPPPPDGSNTLHTHLTNVPRLPMSPLYRQPLPAAVCLKCVAPQEPLSLLTGKTLPAAARLLVSSP